MYTEFVNSTARTMVLMDIGNLHPPEAVRRYVDHLLASAASRIINERKLHLDANNIADLQLVSMYAAWLYRKRDSGAAMPDMLRAELNDRKIRERTASE